MRHRHQTVGSTPAAVHPLGVSQLLRVARMRARCVEPSGHAQAASGQTNQNRTVRTYSRTPKGVMKTTANPAARGHARQQISGGMLLAMLLQSPIAAPATDLARQRAAVAVGGINS